MDATISRDGISTVVTLAIDTSITAGGDLVPAGHVDAVRKLGTAGRIFSEGEAIRVGLLDADGGARPIDGPDDGDENDENEAAKDITDLNRQELFALAHGLGMDGLGNITNANLIDAIENEMAKERDD